MKATLIIDSPGPNPAYAPPLREKFATEEDWHDAMALYDVPAEVIVPAGTLLAGPLTWVHCFPDASGIIMVKGRDPNSGRITAVPKRIGTGVVRAIPADDACKAALARHVEQAARQRGVSVAAVEQEIAQCVAESQAAQQANDKQSGKAGD